VALDESQALGQGTVVALLPDGGERYLSTSLFVSETVSVPLHFYNTLTAKVEPFEPVRPGKVAIYSCGPSLDGPTDLGLCRRVVFSDVLRRHLEDRGYEVKHVMNLGDIDDRTVNECLKAGRKLKEFTDSWERAFFHDLDTLRVKRAHHYPRASEHVNDMVEQTRSLLERELAYEKLRSVYFRIGSFPGYGQLSRIEPEQMRSSASTSYDYYEKDSPRDFALFKRSTLAELKAGISWRTPWGNARPGWHVECASMAVKYLGQPFDIHTASTDLTFPHGDNEIAIACGINGKPLAKFWMHSEVVMADGKKVSRAAGNDLTLQRLLDEGFDGPTIRYWLLATHYRKVLKYSREELARARQCVRRLNEFVVRLREFKSARHNPDLDQVLYDVHMGWQQAMDHDLNVSRALGKLFAFVRHGNRLMNDGELDQDQARQILEVIVQANRTIEIVDFEDERSDARLEQLFAERNKARQNKDFQRADALRDELRTMGIHLTDRRSGTRWKRVSESR
jgi:cysteinyl-tRNA synthetase